MKKFLLFVLFLISINLFVFSQEDKQVLTSQGESWINNTGMFSRYHSNKFSDTGLYSGYKAEDEVLANRTQHSKTFDKGSGSYEYMLIGDLHYKDANDLWQDIDVSIKTSGNTIFPYANTTNKFRTYYTNSIEGGIKVSYLNTDFELAKNTKISLVNGGNSVVVSNADVSADLLDYRTINFSNFAQDIDYQYIQL
ncbi:MAG: hypothetical protein LBV69_05395, partial [Bacteroidales bacterium]|nr:hypothetical protein [Bacteroidales bacterium]